jgi:hypothetical protein
MHSNPPGEGASGNAKDRSSNMMVEEERDRWEGVGWHETMRR